VKAEELKKLKNKFKEVIKDCEGDDGVSVFMTIVKGEESAECVFAGEEGIAIGTALATIGIIRSWLEKNGVVLSADELIQLTEELTVDHHEL
jgi:hypothetical protein